MERASFCLVLCVSRLQALWDVLEPSVMDVVLQVGLSSGCVLPYCCTAFLQLLSCWRWKKGVSHHTPIRSPTLLKTCACLRACRCITPQSVMYATSTGAMRALQR